MAVTPEAFTTRKRRPSAKSFISPNLTDAKFLESLLQLSQEISSLNYASPVIRKLKLLTLLFEELTSNRIESFPPSAHLCFEELYITLQRIKTTIEDCEHGSKIWLIMKHESVASTFHELMVDLSTVLDVFPVKEFDMNDEFVELVDLIRKQCSDTKSVVDTKSNDLKMEVLNVLDMIRREIVPDRAKLLEIFEKLDLRDSLSCRDEIESLEEEFRNQTCEKPKGEVISLIGLVRYAKCVLYGASTPRALSFKRLLSTSDMNLPVDFRCPITLDLMRDPVVVATGQTYDRSSINTWISSGHTTCPKTGQVLAHTDLVPNCAMKNLIALWCRDHKIPFDESEVKEKNKSVTKNKTASEAAKMTIWFLVEKLAELPTTKAAIKLIHELRVLAKTDSDSRAIIGEAGAIPLLVHYLTSEDPNLQVNVVTTLLNLSILEGNKKVIVDTHECLNGIIEVLRSGATWEAKGNAAATIFSLSTIPSCRKKIGRKTGTIKGLIALAKSGPRSTRKDALMAIINLAVDRETTWKLIELGVMETIHEVTDDLPEESVMVMEMVVQRGGQVAVEAAHVVIQKLAALLVTGSEKLRERALVTLVTICRAGGSEMVQELAGVSGIERLVWGLTGNGTTRARRKAASLLRILRRWAAGLDRNVTATAPS